MSSLTLEKIRTAIPKHLNFRIKIHRLATLTAENQANLQLTGVIFSRAGHNSILVCWSILANALALEGNSINTTFRRSGFRCIHPCNPIQELVRMVPAMTGSRLKWKMVCYTEGYFDLETTEVELHPNPMDLVVDHTDEVLGMSWQPPTQGPHFDLPDQSDEAAAFELDLIEQLGEEWNNRTKKNWH